MPIHSTLYLHCYLIDVKYCIQHLIKGWPLRTGFGTQADWDEWVKKVMGEETLRERLSQGGQERLE